MEIFAVSDLVVEVRNKTLIKYEGYVKDGENAYLSDATYKRAFEREFREKLDDLISASACVVLRDSEGMKPYMDNPDGHSAWLMSAQAETVAAGCERLLYLPYLMGERTPHLDADARGVFFGLSAVHTKKHMLRAVMEGVAYSLRDCVEIFREMGISVSDMAACGGGGSSALWRSMLADLYGCGVKTVTSKEGPALGAAILASVGAGVYSSVEQACDAVVHSKDTTSPDAERAKVYEQYYQLYRSLYPALKESYQKLKAL